MTKIVIEKLKKEDLKEAISIYDTNHETTTNYEKLYKEYDSIYNNPAYHNIVAKIDEEIVGLATIVINSDIVEELQPFLTVWNLGVAKKYRRMKIGTAILNYIYEYAKNLNCSFISLIAEKDNLTAQKFYDSLGYAREVGFVKFITK